MDLLHFVKYIIIVHVTFINYFPMFDSLAGALKLTPRDVANHMLDAINLFSQSNPTYLRLVRIVIFKQTMIESFRRYFLEKANTSRTTTTGIGENKSDVSNIEKFYYYKILLFACLGNNNHKTSLVSPN